MKFNEFVNRNKNVMQSRSARIISSSIEITEERDAFFNGDLFKKYDTVESNGVQYHILEQCSNYYAVVDSEGNVSRKFAKQLTKVEPVNMIITESNLHGYQIQTEEAKRYLKTNFIAETINNDDVGILKQLKEVDSKMNTYTSKDKLTVAKIIADAVGVKHDAISDPTNLVNAAIRKAKKDPNLMKNKEILQNMLHIAMEVGINISDKSFEVNESEAPLKHHSVVVSYHKKSDPHRRYEARYKTTHNLGKEETEKRAKAAFDAKGKVVYNMVHESEELEELSVGTLKSFAEKGKESATKLVSQGAKAKKPENAYSKFKKASTRLSNVDKANKKAFSKDWKERTGQNESVEEQPEEVKTSMTYDEMMKLYRPEVDAEAHELPHGHNFGHTSDAHRKQLIRKLRGA